MQPVSDKNSYKNSRVYGEPPFRIAVLHGGPGAGGEMAPVARELASNWSILEPIQTATSLEGQIKELRTVLKGKASLPVSVIGHSWGAWLGFILAARYPTLVKKLILVSSGPYETKYLTMLQESRFARLTQKERAEFQSLVTDLSRAESEYKDEQLARLGALASKADNYDPLVDAKEGADLVGPRGDIFQRVWASAAKMRETGELLELAEDIRCPVVAIHGDYDPHPAEGVEAPLSRALEDFRFVLIENCGHTPWIERQAREKFYTILREVVGEA